MVKTPDIEGTTGGTPGALEPPAGPPPPPPTPSTTRTDIDGVVGAVPGAFEPTGSAPPPPPPPPVEAPFRVCSGRATNYVDTLGRTWVADTHYTNGAAYNNAMGIYGTDDDPLYYSGRWDDGDGSTQITYRFPITNGPYWITLLFAEVVSTRFAVGARTFDIYINGVFYEQGLDVYAEAGAYTALDKTYYKTVTNSVIEIRLVRRVDRPFICGIAIESATLGSALSPGGINTQEVFGGPFVTTYAFDWTVLYTTGIISEETFPSWLVTVQAHDRRPINVNPKNIITQLDKTNLTNLGASRTNIEAIDDMLLRAEEGLGRLTLFAQTHNANLLDLEDTLTESTTLKQSVSAMSSSAVTVVDAEETVDYLDAKDNGGIASVSGTNTFVTITVSQPDTSYTAIPSINAVYGAVPDGAKRIFVSNKTTTSFRVNLEEAPGAGNSVTVGWILRS